MITVERFPSASDFLGKAEGFLLKAELENSVIFGIAQGVASGLMKAGPQQFWAVVRDDNEIVMAAFMTLPGRLGITRTTKPGAIAALARDIQANGPTVETGGGLEPTSGQFAAELAKLLGAKSERRMAQRIHELRRVDHLGDSPGRLRLATAAEHALLTEWAADFYIVVGDGSDPAKAVKHLTENEQLYVWDDKGPKSMAAWTGKTPSGVRIAYVYTPPALRGKGYATSCVAHLTHLMLKRGNKYCCLYTDLSNPTSNAIYARIGYRGVADAGVYRIGQNG